MKHTPVLLTQVLEAFQGKHIRVFFEGTVGAGGHAAAVLEAHPEIETYFACDRDDTALKLAKEKLEPWKEKVRFIHRPFGDLDAILKEQKEDRLDGFLLDLGVSSMQLDQGDRGFSFRAEAPLDMRMDVRGSVTAANLVNELPEVELARIFHEYGEEHRSRAAAKAIVAYRKKRKIATTQELIAVLDPVLRKGKIHPATKVFQALRIVVNDELGQLKQGLERAMERLSVGGVMAVISFHSLEDRIVKWALRESETVAILTKKPLEASREEIAHNKRSRSAKLRIAVKR
jgi:16S rRNA (cytosine1402-N4)-methyltransferase